MAGFDPVAYALAKRALLRAIKASQELEMHEAKATQVHNVGSYYIAKTSRSDQLPSWVDIPDKPSQFPPEPHGANHNIGEVDEIPDLVALRSDFDNHVVTKFAHHGDYDHKGLVDLVTTLPSAGIVGRLIIKTDTKELYYDDGSNIVKIGKLAGLDLDAHGSRHNIGGADEIPDLATLRSDFDTHKGSITDHVPTGKYIAYTSRNDQAPSWDDIPDKPSTFPPDPHTHGRDDIPDFWNTPFWGNIPDKPILFQRIASGSATGVTSVAITGLNGDTHGIYLLVLRALNNYTSDNYVFLRFNGDATTGNYDGDLEQFDSGSNLYRSSPRDIPILRLPAGAYGIAVAFIYAKSGKQRCVSAIGGAPGKAEFAGGVWKNTTDNLTEIDIGAEYESVDIEYELFAPI